MSYPGSGIKPDEWKWCRQYLRRKLDTSFKALTGTCVTLWIGTSNEDYYKDFRKIFLDTDILNVVILE
jgi:hypothetical protein